MGEPVLVNPNSYINVKIILDDECKKRLINSNRKWTILGCDGPAYCQIKKRILFSDDGK